ncbi:MAG: N-acetyltransferase [Candidatus Omnitrophota bacterium]|jgi:amino-acid N-acetyltransferase
MVRKARVKDIRRIHELIGFYAAKKDLLPRPESEISEAVRDFFVFDSGSNILGCAALHIYSDKLAEIRSLAADSAHLNKGIGGKLVDACLEEAANLGIKSVFALTKKTEFFGKFGFVQVSKNKLPQKIWNDCSICPKFAKCDEVAYIKEL